MNGESASRPLKLSNRTEQLLYFYILQVSNLFSRFYVRKQQFTAAEWLLFTHESFVIKINFNKSFIF